MYMCLPVGIASVVGGAVINSVVVGEAVVTCTPVVVGGTGAVAVDAMLCKYNSGQKLHTNYNYFGSKTYRLASIPGHLCGRKAWYRLFVHAGTKIYS